MCSAAAEPAGAVVAGPSAAVAGPDAAVAGFNAVVACLKWVDRHPEIDPLTGSVVTDSRTSGPSDADEAALEWALRAGEAWGVPVLAVTASGPEADPMLTGAVAAGAGTAVRVDMDPASPSAAVAAAVAAAVTRPAAGGGGGAGVVFCGAWSLDRGSGSFPAFLAAESGAAQALGVVALDLGAPGQVRAERRLDGGRRERLAVRAPAVVSVEASTARLRRASLDGVLAAPSRPPAVVAAPPAVITGPGAGGSTEMTVGPWRPRPRHLPGPAAGSARERVLELTGAGRRRPAARLVTLPAGEAAAALLEQLRAWGYLD